MLNFEQAAFPEQPHPPQTISSGYAAIVHGDLPPVAIHSATKPEISPAVEFGWNFVDVFPTPLVEAIEASVFGYEDPAPNQVESIHVELANELLAVLDELAACKKAKLDGVNPTTGKRPRTAATRRRLSEQLEQEPARLNARFDDLLQAYADGFGDRAAASFAEWVRTLHRNQSPRPHLRSQGLELPVPTPLSSAVEKGVFGTDENGEPVSPSEEEVHEITLNQGELLAELFEEMDSVNERLVANPTNREELVHHRERIACRVQGILALYEEDFGETAARHLKSWAQATAHQYSEVHSPAASAPQFGSGHPWHYLARGDGQTPVPVDAIPAGDCDGTFAGKLPTNAAKRRDKLSQMLSEQTRQLDEDKARYSDIVARGAAALSEYDRTIAYGGDAELAVASSLALKFNHISNGLGRVQWLKSRLGPGEPPAV